MSVPSVPAKQQKVGSNLKAHKALVAANQALVTRRDEPLRRAERKFLRARATLLRPIVKPATIIFGEAKAASSQAFLRAGGDGAAIANARRRARRAIDRALRERGTGYHEYEALRQSYADEYRALIAARREASKIGGFDLQIGDILLRPDLGPNCSVPHLRYSTRSRRLPASNRSPCPAPVWSASIVVFMIFTGSRTALLASHSIPELKKPSTRLSGAHSPCLGRDFSSGLP